MGGIKGKPRGMSKKLWDSGLTQTEPSLPAPTNENWKANRTMVLDTQIRTTDREVTISITPVWRY